MMKKVIFILILCAAALAGFSQLMQTNNTPGGYRFVNLKVTDGLWVAKGGVDTPNVGTIKVGENTTGMIYYDTVGFKLYFRVNPRWVEFEGGGSVSGIDSIYYRGGAAVDSFFYEKDGTEYFWYANPAQDRVIYGGVVTWTGTALDYFVTSCYWRKNGVYYLTPDTTVTLPPLADVDSSRTDVFVTRAVSESWGYITTITGTESANPVTPQIDGATDLRLTDITLNPNQTTGATDTLIVYDNLSGGEFENRSGTGVTVTFNNTTNVYRIPYSANVGAINNNDVIGFGTATTRDISSKLSLSFAIQLKAVMPNNNGMLVSIWSNGVQVGSEVGIPFNRTDLNYQLFSIPLSSFALTSTLIDSVRFRYSGGGAGISGMYMDWIYFQGNFNPGGGGTGVEKWVTQGTGIIVDSTPNPNVYNIAADTTLIATHHYVDSSISASGGGNTKYVLGEYGLVNDSATTNLYKLRVDSSVIASHTYVQNWLANYTALNGTGYVKMSGTTPAYRSNAQLTSDINTFTQTLSGAVPQPTTLNGYFLKDDGTWAKAIVPADTAAMLANYLYGVAGENYLSKSGHYVVANPVNLATSNVTGVLPIANGGTNNTTFTAYSPIYAGTTPTGAFQSSTLGASGTVLTSTGTGSLPTWQTPVSAWSINGNAGTNSGTNFLGTTDNRSLRFRTNNIQRVHIDSATGAVGIGTITTAGAVLTIVGSDASTYGFNVQGTTAAFNLIQATTNTGEAGFTLRNDQALATAGGTVNIYGSTNSVTWLRNQMAFGSRQGLVFQSNNTTLSGGSSPIDFYTGGGNESERVMRMAEKRVAINTAGTTLIAHASSALEITSTNKGILIPRMTTAERNGIGAAPNLLLTNTELDINNDYSSTWTVDDGTIFTQTADKNINTTVTETTLFGTGSGTRTIPASYLYSGNTIIIKIQGYMTTNGAPTLDIKFKLGSTTIASTGAVTLVAVGSNGYFEAECTLTARASPGASAAIMGQGYFTYHDTQTTANHVTAMNTATVNAATNGSLAVDVTATWGTSDAANKIVSTNAYVEIKN